MSRALKPLPEQTLVVTGATSGIGLATALEAARRGARLVLVARDPTDLEDAGARCRTKGAEVETVVADVADRATLDLVAERAQERFGGFDTWINNAGVSVYGRLTDVPMEDARQVFETNYWGTVNGSLVAAEHFKTRGDGTSAALINVGSVLSERAIPLQGHYCASKHAIKAFTDSLRMELEKDGVPVSVTLIKPSSIDTNYPTHAANRMEHAPSFPPPVYEPEVVARGILACATQPKRELTIGAGGKMIELMGTFAPRLSDKYMEASTFDAQQADRPADADRAGTLHAPEPNDGGLHGPYEGRTRSRSLYTQMALHPVATAAGALAASAGAAYAWFRN